MSSSLWGCELKNHAICQQIYYLCHPPCEDVSWKAGVGQRYYEGERHPPCEDVSWKMRKEKKQLPDIVILHVRMWVEKDLTLIQYSGAKVILLVRMWVEKFYDGRKTAYCPSSSLWGCELKNSRDSASTYWFSHPPCEDVSWKVRPGG